MRWRLEAGSRNQTIPGTSFADLCEKGEKPSSAIMSTHHEPTAAAACRPGGRPVFNMHGCLHERPTGTLTLYGLFRVLLKQLYHGQELRLVVPLNILHLSDKRVAQKQHYCRRDIIEVFQRISLRTWPRTVRQTSQYRFLLHARTSIRPSSLTPPTHTHTHRYSIRLTSASLTMIS